MRPRRWTLTVSLMLALVCVCNLIAIAPAASADTLPSKLAFATEDKSRKLAPELEALAYPSHQDSSETETVRVIVQTRANRDHLDEAITSKGGRVNRALPLVGGYVAEVPRSALAAVAFEDDTVYVSLDRPTELLQQGRYDANLVRVTTGAENVVGRSGFARGDRVGDDYLSSLPAGPNGKGVTIAVLDSGIYDDGFTHEDFRALNDPKTRRVLAHRNFVSDESPCADQLNRGYDPYGHGTHVAGIAAGSGRECLQDPAGVGNFYAGMAFNANLVDLRVIGANGEGRISDTIAAIDWMVTNRSAYNIRVANFSIGAAVTQSYKTDPLCQAVERAVRAGITCVVAAGNYGKDSSGKTVYGSILAPGNDPLAITVGAANTQGSLTRSDDAVSSYSSRGPTLVDAVMKPDLVAPGTCIRSVAANGNYLVTTNNLTVYWNKGESVYMWLSGTSMAAPVVSGAAALMLDANPSLTPLMVKSILQFTAQPMASSLDPLLSMLTQGAGYLNADAAVRVAQAFAQDAGSKAAGSTLLASDSTLLYNLLYRSQDKNSGAFTSTIAGETISWGDNIFYSQGLAYFYSVSGGNRLAVMKTAGWQVAPNFLLINGYLATNGKLMLDSRLLSSARIMTDGRLMIEGRTMTEARLMSDAWLWDSNLDVLTNPSAAQSTWSANLMDQSVTPQGRVMNEGRVMAEHAASEAIMAWGDEAPGIQIQRIESKKHPLFPRGKRIKL
jgi:serine protease AprX